MGAGYYVNVVQWSKGDYPYANNPTQDDIGIISTKLTRPAFLGGGASNGAATALTPPTDSAPITSVVGIMSASTELHVYKFRTSGAGAITLKLSVTPPGSYGPRTHLAAKVRVLRADTGAVVGVPFDNVGSSGIDGNVADTPAQSFNIPAAGLYYVELSSTGNGAFATYGYSSYGSSGTYMIALGAPSGLVVNADSPPAALLHRQQLRDGRCGARGGFVHDFQRPARDNRLPCGRHRPPSRRHATLYHHARHGKLHNHRQRPRVPRGHPRPH